ncbi:HNH endonuclease [Bermanella sp. WJH001]|uniref:HNH endonuclease n=1 Tax=Bermanella sp. WJH001 TaxID=3048005 RepID=UPI0024BE9231|nr:HNH endonuclease [Bermanella sp. WJH001]MDJ1537437.1 HNH endonuclease [Bermanella sp. WJH001]
MPFKSQYSEYLFKTNLSGSGKATSYIRALDLLSQMLMIESFGFVDCIDIWAVTSIKRLFELKALVAVEQRKKLDSVWLSGDVAKSYLINGYCQAALTSYAQFLVEVNQENDLFDVFKQYKGTAGDLSALLDTSPKNIDVLLDGIKDTEGEDVIRSVKTRLNQNLFRRMLMDIYHESCCITGLNIPQVNRASHIVSWADDPSKRLDPTNGLYLSATYDAAFDKHLISLDGDYRIIVSKEIKEHYTSKSVNEYFLKIEGDRIKLPYKYSPDKSYLAKHRSRGEF